MVTKDWGNSQVMKRLKFLRRILPGWHRAERVKFRDWYLTLVEDFDAETETNYALWVQMLETPEE